MSSSVSFPLDAATVSHSFNPFELNTDNDGIYETFFNPDMIYNASNSAKLTCDYFTESQLNIMFHEGVKNVFSTFHLNIRSLPKNYDCLKLYLSTLSHSFSVLAFSETWLNDDFVSLYPLSNYNSTHSCRNNRTGGGVSLFVSNVYNFITRKDLSIEFDTTLVETIYRHCIR